MTYTRTIALLATAVSTTTMAQDAETLKPRIAWYGTLQGGLTEARRSGRPILLVSAAPHCSGVSGIW